MALSLFRSSSEAIYGTPNALRDLAVPVLLFPAALFAPAEWLIYVFVVAGQGHFLMTYLYQYKGGKMDRGYLLIAALLLVGSGMYLYLLGEQGVWVFLLVSLMFPIHFAFDEFVLHGEERRPRVFLTILAFSFMAFLATVLYAFPVPLATNAFYVALIVFACAAFARLLTGRESIARTEYYLWFVGALMALLALLGRPEQILSSIIILHGFNWLVAFGKRVEGNPERRREFWRLAALTHGFGLVGFIAFLHLKIDLLRYFFLLFYYDLWAVAHIALTWRTRGGRPKAV